MPPRPATPSPSPVPTPAPTEAPRPEFPWAEETLRGLGLREKVAQMIGIRAAGLDPQRDPERHRALLLLVRDLGVGGVVVFDSEVGSLPRLLNELQGAAPLPLLAAADMERGMSFRIRHGVVPLPYAMAIGATRSEAAAEFAGEVAAREGRALGVHWALAPVADVNSNPRNPVINIRSYGEDPDLVARLVSAFVRGAASGGVLTTVKHFPGHGDTTVDSHLGLATVSGGRDRLDSVELLPFRAAVAAGVDAVMLGHVSVPTLDPSGEPATLSPLISEGLLREEMGFGGLIVTDALDMAGIAGGNAGDAAVKAVLAGADFILLPRDPVVAVEALVRAVDQGLLSEARIDASVRRILEAKERLGLDRQRLVDPDLVAERVARPADRARALEVARRSITVVQNRGDVLPLRAEEPIRLLHLVLSSDAKNGDIQGIPEEELKRRQIDVETRTLGPDVSETVMAEVRSRARAGFTHVLVSAFARVTGSKGTADMCARHAKLVRSLAESGPPVVVVSFGSPYLLRQFPEVPVYVCGYGSAESTQRAAIGAVFGEYPVSGRLPVRLPGLYDVGDGLEIPRRAMTLRWARPEEVGFRPGGLDEVDRLLERAVEEKAFPGAVVAVGKDGALVHLRAVGRLSYDEGSAPVRTDTLYDLASLTKVVATTTMAMVLVDTGRLRLDQPVGKWLPHFQGGGREKVTPWHLLTHSSGLDWWAPLYEELSGKAAFVERIESMPLVYRPGSRSVYSDLGTILLGEVLERAAGQSLDDFTREQVLDPLGMRETRFKPEPEQLPRVAPTEVETWRGGLIHGTVHDDNAFAMGGVAPHAGLFGTAGDLARFAQMMLNGGVLEHHRVAARATVERFTKRAGIPGSSRALGWDTPEPPSSAGQYFSERSFGHLGFTGTSIWIDPDRRLFLILLTNRVHPTRDNIQIRRVRPAVADAVVEALEVR